MNLGLAAAPFFITLREALEASLVVGIVLATLRQAGQGQLSRWVWLGVAFGVGVSVLMGVVSQALLGGFTGKVYHFSKGLFSVVAVVMLTWMLVWMTQQARFIGQRVRESVAQATQKGHTGLAVGTLVSVAILREGAEIVLFLAGALNPAGAEGFARWLPFLGCVGGTALAVLIGVGLFAFGVKMNLQVFFKVLGVMLLLIIAGLLVNALSAFDTANVTSLVLDPATGRYKMLNPPIRAVPWFGLGPLWFDLSPWLPANAFPGNVLNVLFGYTDRWHAVQAVVWSAFLLVAGGFYWRSLAKASHPAKKPAEEKSVPPQAVQAQVAGN